MLQATNLTKSRNFKIRSFEEDKIATLKAHPGLRYIGKTGKFYKFSGNFYLINPSGELIESFEIVILVEDAYPNTFPIVRLVDNKIEKTDDYHMDESGLICFEHTYVINDLISGGLRLYDFVNYFLPKYFSWALIKKYGDAVMLDEWAHKEEGNRQFYEALLGTNDKEEIKLFLKNFLDAKEIKRNDPCYCAVGKKLKHCHLEAALFLKNTSKKDISKDTSLF